MVIYINVNYFCILLIGDDIIYIEGYNKMVI